MFKSIANFFSKKPKEEEKKVESQPSPAEMQKKFESGNFTLDDFASQMSMMNRMGSIAKMMKYVPGMGGMNIPPQALEQAKKEMEVFNKIIAVMTPSDKANPAHLGATRKASIAKDAGVEVSEVNKLIQRFEQMKQYAKLVSKPGGLQNILRGR